MKTTYVSATDAFQQQPRHFNLSVKLGLSNSHLGFCLQRVQHNKTSSCDRSRRQMKAKIYFVFNYKKL